MDNIRLPNVLLRQIKVRPGQLTAFNLKKKKNVSKATMKLSMAAFYNILYKNRGYVPVTSLFQESFRTGTLERHRLLPFQETPPSNKEFKPHPPSAPQFFTEHLRLAGETQEHVSSI